MPRGTLVLTALLLQEELFPLFRIIPLRVLHYTQAVVHQQRTVFGVA